MCPIPAGIDNGQSIRIRDKGEPGVNGGPRGDLLVEVMVAQTSDFPAAGYEHLSPPCPSALPRRRWAATVRIKTVDGEVEYDVKAGTQTDTKVRLKGKGVPSLRNKSVRGDHYVTLVVKTPERLSNEAKELLKQFDMASGNSLNQSEEAAGKDKEKGKDKPKKKGFMDKLKETFEE